MVADVLSRRYAYFLFWKLKFLVFMLSRNYTKRIKISRRLFKKDLRVVYLPS